MCIFEGCVLSSELEGFWRVCFLYLGAFVLFKALHNTILNLKAQNPKSTIETRSRIGKPKTLSLQSKPRSPIGPEPIAKP